MPPRARREGVGQGGPADPTPTATRGRRDPELAQLLAQGHVPGDDDGIDPEIEGEDFLADDTEFNPGGVQVDALPGDVIACKVVAQLDVGDQSAWVTYGMQSQVQPGETETDAAERVIGIVATRFDDASSEMAERIDAQRQAWASRRISGRRS